MSLDLLKRLSAFGLILAGLALPAVAPEVANISVLSLAGVALLLTLGSNGWLTVPRQPAVFLPLAAGALLALAFLFTAKSATEVGAVFYLTPLFVVAPMVLLLAHLPPRRAGWFESNAATVGILGAAAVASYDAFVGGMARAGGSVANPIHFADVTLMLGVLALSGTAFAAAKWRKYYLLGPLIAAYSVVLSGSRGPILAILVVVAVALGYWFVAKQGRRAAWVRALLIIVACAAVFGTALQLGWVDRITQFGVLTPQVQLDFLADGTMPADTGSLQSSTGERLIMYRSAYLAFLDSPWFGHGLVDFPTKAAQYTPEGLSPVIYDHLHNDIADFAVIGGIVGLVAYALLLAAPILQARRAPKGRLGDGVRLLAICTSVGYFAMGLTNAMFGILTPTILYAVTLAVITHLTMSAGTGEAERETFRS